MDTLAVSASIMEPDDYKNLACAIQPKGGLIAVGGMSDIKVRVHAMLCYAMLAPSSPHTPHTHTPFPHVTFVSRPTSDLHRQRGPHPAHRPQRPRPRPQAPRAGGGVVVVRQAAAGVRDITLPSPYFCNILSGTRARTAGTASICTRGERLAQREPNFKKLPVSGSGVDTQKMCGVSNYRCAVTGISVVADTAVT
jgi:hypothetical protein